MTSEPAGRNGVVDHPSSAGEFDNPLVSDPTMWDDSHVEHVFAETEVFSQWRDDYFEGDEDFARFQMLLNSHPTTGDVIPGCGGVRKIRWGARGKGKRGGLRVIHLQVPEMRRILLIHVYHKSEETDLDSETRHEIAALADEYRRTARREQPRGGSR